MFRSTGCIESHIRNIITIQWFDTLINTGSTLIISMETDIREIRLHQAGLDIGNTHLGMSHINTQAIGDCLDGSLCSTIYIATSVSRITSHTTYINNVSMITSHHTRNYQTSHGEESLDIGINHLIPILETTLILRFQATSQACIIDQHINIAPILRNIIHSLSCRFTVTYIKSQSKDLYPLCLQLFLENFQFTGVSTRNDQIVATSCKAACTTLANSAGCTCDKSNFHIL